MGVLENNAYRFITDYCKDNNLWATYDSVKFFIKEIMKRRDVNTAFIAITDVEIKECCRLVSELNQIKYLFDIAKAGL